MSSSSPIHAFIGELEAARKPLKAGAKSGKQLHSQSTRDALRALAEKYFNQVRSTILPANAQDPLVSRVDSAMQRLIPLCHKQASMRSYCTILLEAKGALIEVDSKRVSQVGQPPAVGQPTEIDQLIVETLDKLLPSAANSYRQALHDIQSKERLSWRGPATDFRECLRETLDHLAPDDKVTGQPGFKLEEKANGPTMKQKVRYILKARGQPRSQAETTENAVNSIEDTLGLFVRSVYNRSSISTHVATSRDEVLRVRDLVRVSLCELLEIRNQP